MTPKERAKAWIEQNPTKLSITLDDLEALLMAQDSDTYEKAYFKGYERGRDDEACAEYERNP
jgi:hypothetical protein